MMLMGVPYDLYWFGDPFAVRYFIEAHTLRVEEKRNELDFQAWLVGAYVHEGINASLSQAFSKNSKARYPKEPHTIAERRAQERQKQADAVIFAFNEFAGIAAMYNARRKKLQGGVEDTAPAS